MNRPSPSFRFSRSALQLRWRMHCVTAPMHANKISCASVLGRLGLAPIRTAIFTLAGTKNAFKASTRMRPAF